MVGDVEKEPAGRIRPPYPCFVSHTALHSTVFHSICNKICKACTRPPSFIFAFICFARSLNASSPNSIREGHYPRRHDDDDLKESSSANINPQLALPTLEFTAVPVILTAFEPQVKETQQG